MKVLLINPDWGRTGAVARRYARSWPPLDLLNAAALLRQNGHEPELIDARAVRTARTEIRDRAGAADLILFQSTPLDRWQCPHLQWKSLKNMVEDLPRDRLILAGAHGTLAPELMLETTGASAVLRGEPELSLAGLVEAGGDPVGLPGFSYFTRQTIVHEPDRPPLDPNSLPLPAHDLIRPENYFYELLGPDLALLETSRGCPYACHFCLKAMYGPGVRAKTPDRTILEVEAATRWGAGCIYFMDLEFTWNRSRTLEICRKLIASRLGVRWSCQTRVDTVDLELLSAMKEAGCRLIHFGLETGNPELNLRSGKKITLEQAESALNWCRRLDIKTACFFLMGLPGESPGDRRRTIGLAGRLNPDFASFHPAAPYPGTRLGELSTSPHPFPTCLDHEHDPGELVREIRKAYALFYLHPARLGRFVLSGAWPEKLARLKLFWSFVR